MYHRRIHRPFVVLMSVLLLSLIAALPVTAAVPVDSSTLREAVSAEEIHDHLEAFQAIADANGGTRASGTPGYDASVEYVADLLGDAGYSIEIQTFEFEYEEVHAADLEQISPPTSDTFTLYEDFTIATASANATATGTVQAVDVLINPDGTAPGGSTSGCEAEDFASFEAGNIALVQRGTCDFYVKAINAEDAGASAVIIFNEGNAPDRLEVIFPNVTGDPAVSVPVLGISFEQGLEFYELSQDELVMRIAVDVLRELRETHNVIAETPTGGDDGVVVVGAHLDSVVEGPGINDNGSGAAMILEIALEMAELGITPGNAVRFAFWGAEETGLVGAQHYVSQLSDEEIDNIAANLNFDMVASPNYVRFVYDGDAGPSGSDVIEDVFLDYFAAQGLATEPTEFDGRSDYGPFIDVGIPAGGLFTGAEGIKTEEQAAIYGGTAGEQYDPCYHEACDTIENINMEVLEQMADAAVHALVTVTWVPAKDSLRFNAQLLPESEVPGPGDPDAFGFAKVYLHPETGQLCYRLNVANVEPMAAHIHEGGPDVAGPVVVPLEITGGLTRQCTTVDSALAQAIAANPMNYYVNVHSPDFPAGAIRGQLMMP